VARGLVALHATDPATVFLAVAARVRNPSVAEMESALYVERALLRMLGMRRTMFVVDETLAPTIHAACTRSIATQLRRRSTQLLEAAGVADDVPAWMQRVERATLAALEARREATAQQLGEDVPELRTRIRVAAGKSYEGVQSVTTRILMLLSAEGKVVRGRPRGSWTSSQYHWAPIDAWLPGGLATLPTADAQVRLVREWLHAFGPGTLDDLKWWTGLSVAEVKRATARLECVEVVSGEFEGLLLAEDVGAVASPEPWAALLPALDPTPMGYVHRGWFLGQHGRALFDRSGNIGPTIWVDGRIVGGWAQRNNGTLAYKLLEDVGYEAEHHVRTAAERLEGFVGSVRITPRFRTPLERELST
jgi:hypothetical protein